MKDLVYITTKYYTNLNYEKGGTPNWQYEGQQIFTLVADPYKFEYDEETCIEAIQLMLTSKSDNHNRFEYDTHGSAFGVLNTLDGGVFERVFEKIIETTTHK